MGCSICKVIEEGHDFVVYQDDKLMAVLAEKPTVAGHIQLFPKEHFTIIEQVPDNIIKHAFSVANKLSTALFDSLGAQGTNLILSNGVAAGQKHAHIILNILPRTQNDNMSLEWQPKQLSEEEMSAIEIKLKEHTEKIGKEEPKKEEKEKPAEISDEENYLLKSLRRIP